MGSCKIVRRFSEDSVEFNWIDLRFLRVRRDLLGLFGIFWDYLGFLESFGIFWDSVRSSEDFHRILLNSIGLFETFEGSPGLFGIIWDLLGSSGIFWDLLGSFGIFLDLFWIFWDSVRLSQDFLRIQLDCLRFCGFTGIFWDLFGSFWIFLGFYKIVARFSMDSIGLFETLEGSTVFTGIIWELL